MKEAAKTHSVQPCLRLFRTALIQFHAIGIAVISLGKLPQSLPAATAWVDQIRGDPLREPDALENQRDIVWIRWVIAQLDVVHQAANHSGIGLLPHRKGCRKLDQSLIDRLISGAHKVKSGKPFSELTGRHGLFVFLHLQQEKLRFCQIFHQRASRALQFGISVPCCGEIRLPEFLNPCPLDHHALRELKDLSLKLNKPVQCVGFLRLEVRLLAHRCIRPFAEHSSCPAAGCRTTSSDQHG